MGERGGVVTAGEGEEDPRRHGGEVETLVQESYRERENQGDMEEIGGVITTGEGDPRRCGGEVESLLQERQRYTQGDMEEIGGVVIAGE